MADGQYPLVNYALCKVEDVKAVLDNKLLSSDDAAIALFINGFSSFCQEYLNRKLYKDTYTEHFDGGRCIFMVDSPPITIDDILKVYLDTDRLFGENTLLVKFDDYSVIESSGKIKITYSDGTLRRIPDANRILKVVYRGGLVKVDEPNNIYEFFEPLRNAAVIQCSSMFQNRKNLSLQARSEQGSYSQLFKATELLPAVENTLKMLIHYKIF